jgi:predicted porin
MDAWKIGGSYTFLGSTTLGLAWETQNLDDNIEPGADLSHDNWFLSLKHSFGPNDIKFQWAHADDMEDVEDSSADLLAIGLAHNLSKRTQVYALYAQTDNDDNATYGIGKGSGNEVFPVAGEDKANGVSLGFIHKF